MTKIVHSFHPDTRLYTGPITLDDSDLSPLEPGVYLIPGDCVEAEPPSFNTGQRIRWSKGAWVVEDIPVLPAPIGVSSIEPAPIKIDPASFLNLPTPAAETTEDEKKRLVSAVQKYMDTMAQGFGYDNINSAVTYAEEPAVQKFQEEGRAFREWRSVVWARCYELFDDVQYGRRSTPTEQELIALLPLFDPNKEQKQG
ncbi:hypothetical protein WIX39_022610 [Variovorax sp. AB1(2024)]|uniref:hypothetical protein n=1 Tax=Variovorax sp. AB1(2024) TaxID=3132214 RepID=UPI00309CCE3F